MCNEILAKNGMGQLCGAHAESLLSGEGGDACSKVHGASIPENRKLGCYKVLHDSTTPACACGITKLSKETPTTPLRSRQVCLSTPSCRSLRLSLQLPQALDLLQYQLEHIFPPDHIEMCPHPRVFPGESLNLAVAQMST